ncbi:MAG TPA: hypothetical protein VLB44_05465 [Kofleriaceae bacterium]|nr:hypothetical protein [Kofleriaceae bacterium]
MRWLWIACLWGCRFRFDAVDARGDDTAVADMTDDAVVTVCHGTSWSTPVLIGELATASEESRPEISRDGLTLYFSSNRATSMGRAIWVATRASTSVSFDPPTRIIELDDAADDKDPAISADGLTIYFTSDRGVPQNIYVASRATLADPFVVQGVLAITGAPATPRAAPALTGDELTMFYVDGIDLAVATRPTTSSPFAFDRLLTELNAPQTDGDPTITADGLELFFDSTRTGQAAVFRATRADTSSAFSPPVEMPELVPPGSLSTGQPGIRADGRTLYMFGDTGQIDLYVATRTCP